MNAITKFARVFSTVVIIALAGNAWAGSTRYYARAFVESSDLALGKVYVSIDEEKRGNEQVADNSQLSSDDETKWAEVKFFRWAEAEPGCKFVKWDDESTEVNSQKNMKATSADENDPTVVTWTAIFERIPTYYGQVAVEPNDASMGKVFVSTDNVKGIPVAGCVTSEVASCVGETSMTFYRWAEPKPGYVFRGWSDGKKVANDAVNLPVTRFWSKSSEAPTMTTWTAVFGKSAQQGVGAHFAFQTNEPPYSVDLSGRGSSLAIDDASHLDTEDVRPECHGNASLVFNDKDGFRNYSGAAGDQSVMPTMTMSDGGWTVAAWVKSDMDFWNGVAKKWQHVCLVYDPERIHKWQDQTQPSATNIYYIVDTMEEERDSSFYFNSVVQNMPFGVNDSKLTLGGRIITNESFTAANFSGRMDDIVFINRPLTTMETERLYYLGETYVFPSGKVDDVKKNDDKADPSCAFDTCDLSGNGSGVGPSWWSSYRAPMADNDYIVDNDHVLKKRDMADDAVFEGRSLTLGRLNDVSYTDKAGTTVRIAKSGHLLWNTMGTLTINELILRNGSMSNCCGRLEGHVVVRSPADDPFVVDQIAPLTIAAPLKGNEGTRLRFTGVESLTFASGALRDYKGDLAVASDTTVTLSVNDGVEPETVTFAEVAADRKISFVFENYASLPLEDASYPVATLPAGASFARTTFALGDGWVARTVADDSDANRRVIRLEVGQKRVDAAIANVNTVYTGNWVTSPEPEVFEPAGGAVTRKWSADNGATFTLDNPQSWKDAGVHTNFVQVSTAVAGYEPVVLQSIVTIAKADYDMSAYRLEDTEYVYEEDKTFTLTLTGGALPAGLSVAYTDNTLSQVGSTLATATFTVDDAANFNVPASQTAWLTVMKNESIIALTVLDRTIQMKILGTYADQCDLILCWGAEAGKPDSTNGWSHVKTVTAQVESDEHVITNGVFWGDDEIPNGSKIRAFLVDSSDNVQLSSNMRNFSYAWNKVKATLSGEGTYPYDGTAHGLSVANVSPEDCTVEWFDENDTAYGNIPPSYVEGGRHVSRVTVSCRGYEPLTLTGTITITPKPVVVTAENRTYSKVYGMSDPNFNYTLSREIPVVGALGRYAGEDVGTYQVTAGTLASESPSYKLVFNPIDATLEITKATYDLSGVVLRSEISCTVAQLAETPKPYEVTGTLPAGVTVSYTGSGTTATAPGDYTVTAHFTGDEVNYEPIRDERTCNLHVRENLDSIEATVKDGSHAYDGQPYGPSVEITNPAGGAGCTVEWFDENDTPCGATPPRYVEGGHHKSRVTVSAIGREDFSNEVTTVISDNAFEVMEKGDDSSATGPFRTIKRALEVAKAAVTNGTLSAAVVRVHPGRYVEASRLVLDFPVTVTGGGGSREKVVFDPERGTHVPNLKLPPGAVLITSPQAVLTSLTIQNGRIDNAPGGNIAISAGVVSNCVVRNGLACKDDSPQGANISMSGSALVVDTVFTGGSLYTGRDTGKGLQASVSGGTFRRCVFRDTTCALKNCSVIYVSGATRFENCQFSGFSVTGSNGFVFDAGATLTLVNCTVARNVLGGGVFKDAANVTACNTVVYGNGGTPTKEWSNANETSFMNCAFSVSARFPDETSSVQLRDEDFAGFASGDYRPFPGGRLVGTGSKGAYGATGAKGGLDLAGQPRFIGTLDLGAYELQPTALTVQLASSTNNVEVGTPVTPVTLTATAFAAKGEVAWAWSVNGVKVAADTATYAFTPADGIYAVVAKATAGGETAEATNVIRAIAADASVAEAWVGADGDDVGGAGTADSPFATIAKAKGFLDAYTNDAVQTIHVGAGFYAEGGVLLNRALVVSGDVTNPTKAVIHSSSTNRVFELSDDAARVEGVKVQGKGRGSGNGGLLTIASGTVSDCVITGGASGNGGNVYMAGGKLERCKVGKGAATSSNKATTTQGGNVWVKGGLVANSLITGGRATNGAGLYVSGAATVLNCTVVDNSPSATAGAGVFCASDTARVVNTVIYGNGGTPALEWGGEKGGCFKKCAFAAGVKPEGAVCVDTVTDGAFANYEGGDYRLSRGSVLIGGGTSWIDYCETYGGSEADTDLGRNPRKRGYYLDVGCYQHLPLGTLILLR